MNLFRFTQNRIRTALQELLAAAEPVLKIVEQRAQQRFKKRAGFRIRLFLH